MATATSWLEDLELSIPVIAAPMAGGPTTPALVAAAAEAGGLGFLPGGYRTADTLAAEIAATRSHTARFGVNLFAPNPQPIDPDAFRRYAREIQPEADEYKITLAGDKPVEDDDYWTDKIDLLRNDPVPVVSFTFAIPDVEVIRALQRAGSLVVQTVTSAQEAALAAEAGVDVLAVQACAAGGHSGTLIPDLPRSDMSVVDLVRSVRQAVSLPVIAAGGLSNATEVAAALRAGAEAVMVGTVLLRTDESGASQAYKVALADPRGRDTLVTRAFTGRPARAVPNRFTDNYDHLAPAGYPALHHLTRPLRQAAAAANDSERINLWAGTGYRMAPVGPAHQVLTQLAGNI